MLAFPCFVNSTEGPRKPHAEQSLRGAVWKARGLERERGTCLWASLPGPGNFSRPPLRCQLHPHVPGTSHYTHQRHWASGATQVLSAGSSARCAGQVYLSHPQSPQGKDQQCPRSTNGINKAGNSE